MTYLKNINKSAQTNKNTSMYNSFEMHAFLIVSNSNTETQNEIDKLIKVNSIKNVLPFTLEKIEDSRELKKLVKYSFNQKTAFLIKDIDKATEETLNSFLKNLEEPSNDLFYILTAKSIEGVLETITSRCQIIFGANKMEVKDLVTKDFFDLSEKEQFKVVEKVKDRQEAIDFLNSLVFEAKEKKFYQKLEIIMSTLIRVSKNGNLSLQLTNLLVTMNRYGK